MALLVKTQAWRLPLAVPRLILIPSPPLAPFFSYSHLFPVPIVVCTGESGNIYFQNRQQRDTSSLCHMTWGIYIALLALLRASSLTDFTLCWVFILESLLWVRMEVIKVLVDFMCSPT